MKNRLPLAIATILVIAVSIVGLTRLRFETDILEVLPRKLPSVEALKISQQHFDNDQQVALLLQGEEEIFEEDVADLANILRERLAPARVLYKSEFEENPEAFGNALAEIWRYAPPADVLEMEERLLDEPSLSKHLEKVKTDIRDSFDQQKSTMAAYDPLGFLQHPAMLQFLDNELSFQSDDGKSWIILIGSAEQTMDYHKHEAWLKRIRSAADDWEGLE